jgi:hypothetical protein
LGRNGKVGAQGDAQDQRIEEATAKTPMALEGLAEADDARIAATAIVGEALRELLAADVSPVGKGTCGRGSTQRSWRRVRRRRGSVQVSRDSVSSVPTLSSAALWRLHS